MPEAAPPDDPYKVESICQLVGYGLFVSIVDRATPMVPCTIPTDWLSEDP